MTLCPLYNQTVLETDFIKLLRKQDALLNNAVKMRIKERYGKNVNLSS